MSKFGDTLLKHRTSLKLTQKEMAAVLGIGEKMYYRYEAGMNEGTERRQKEYLNKIDLYRKTLLPSQTDPPQLSEPDHAYTWLTPRDTPPKPPERDDAAAAMLKMAENMSELIKTNHEQHRTIALLLRRIDALQKEKAADLNTGSPKATAAAG